MGKGDEKNDAKGKGGKDEGSRPGYRHVDPKTGTVKGYIPSKPPANPSGKK